MVTSSRQELNGMLNLDTHIIIQFIDQRLDPNLFQILSKTDDYYISPIVFWELAMLHSRKRITFNFDSQEWKHFSQDLKVLPLDEKIAIQSTQLDFNSDPADQIIAATSIVTGIPLLTKDKIILSSKLVPFAH